MFYENIHIKTQYNHYASKRDFGSNFLNNVDNHFYVNVFKHKSIHI
jgi:hypothetical protein